VRRPCSVRQAVAGPEEGVVGVGRQAWVTSAMELPDAPAVVVQACGKNNGRGVSLDKDGMDLGFDILATWTLTGKNRILLLQAWFKTREGM
jgi:hypothetical protein